MTSAIEQLFVFSSFRYLLWWSVCSDLLPIFISCLSYWIGQVLVMQMVYTSPKTWKWAGVQNWQRASGGRKQTHLNYHQIWAASQKGLRNPLESLWDDGCLRRFCSKVLFPEETVTTWLPSRGLSPPGCGVALSFSVHSWSLGAEVSKQEEPPAPHKILPCPQPIPLNI